ncbi:MAG: hypothetical protein ACXIT9_04145 [Nitritalea sp.]
MRKKLDQILHLLVLLYFAVSLVFFLSFDSFKGLFGLESLRTVTVNYFLLFGLLLFLAAWGSSWLVRKSLQDEADKKELAVKEIKAKLYDLEKGIKLQRLEKGESAAGGEEDKPGSSLRPRQNFKS